MILVALTRQYSTINPNQMLMRFANTGKYFYFKYSFNHQSPHDMPCTAPKDENTVSYLQKIRAIEMQMPQGCGYTCSVVVAVESRQSEEKRRERVGFLAPEIEK